MQDNDPSSASGFTNARSVEKAPFSPLNREYRPRVCCEHAWTTTGTVDGRTQQRCSKNVGYIEMPNFRLKRRPCGATCERTSDGKIVAFDANIRF
jgi:hypothetical protein